MSEYVHMYIKSLQMFLPDKMNVCFVADLWRVFLIEILHRSAASQMLLDFAFYPQMNAFSFAVFIKSFFFNLIDQSWPEQTSDVREYTLLPIVDYKTKISTKNSAWRSTVDISTVFRRLKKIRFAYKLDTWVSHYLREQDKSDSVSVAKSLLLYLRKGAVFGYIFH